MIHISAVKKALALVVLLAVAWLWLHEPAAKWRGIPAPNDPVQTGAHLPKPFRHDRYTVTPLARYAVTAVVLSRERYRYDHEAELAPVDLALGWGPMSIASVINDLEISQSARWYEYRPKDEPPLDLSEIVSHSANTHCLPANDDVRDTLLSVRRHELVKLQGYLVEITLPDGYRWTSSLSRTDTGGHACEVFWITSATRWSL